MSLLKKTRCISLITQISSAIKSKCESKALDLFRKLRTLSSEELAKNLFYVKPSVADLAIEHGLHTFMMACYEFSREYDVDSQEILYNMLISKAIGVGDIDAIQCILSSSPPSPYVGTTRQRGLFDDRGLFDEGVVNEQKEAILFVADYVAHPNVYREIVFCALNEGKTDIAKELFIHKYALAQIKPTENNTSSFDELLTQMFGRADSQVDWPDEMREDSLIVLLERYLRATHQSPLDYLLICEDRYKDIVLKIAV